ncbi:hypothetical protein TNIN_58551 [Trichonephila inaurata madagascariensis]|uniref:Uncharacterized protein n=1 Tax=Trichonephila inaurata madagascariensis TaxID=2747483 RepID=A0A8X6XEW6_9ARAC|nr:hypothetical protein TNIN_58551 [Trichonephila inaurata madagascariensis]
MNRHDSVNHNGCCLGGGPLFTLLLTLHRLYTDASRAPNVSALKAEFENGTGTDFRFTPWRYLAVVLSLTGIFSAPKVEDQVVIGFMYFGGSSGPS